MLEDVVSWDIQITTGNLDSRILPDLSTRASHESCFLRFPLTVDTHMVLSRSMKDSKRLANKRKQGTRPCSAPDARYWALRKLLRYIQETSPNLALVKPTSETQH